MDEDGEKEQISQKGMQLSQPAAAEDSTAD
jgi:hypothetical protein